MNFSKSFNIGPYPIHSQSPCFIIAEAGVNHNGNLEWAHQLIDVAAESGAHAVKFQTFKAENLLLKGTTKAAYQIETTGSSESQFEMIKSLELTLEQTAKLQTHANSRGIIFLTTAFDEESLEALDPLNLPAYKVASTDTTNIPFLKKIAQKRKPILLSTGMTYMEEIKKALHHIEPIHRELILLQCTSSYPMRTEDAHLRVLETYRQHFDLLVGYSDHSEGLGVSPVAAALGARVLEKHFTLDRNLPGPDHRASLNPKELASYVQEIKKVEVALGNSKKMPTEAEIQIRKVMQKQFVARHMISKGTAFSDDNVVAKRAEGSGVSPIDFDALFGRTASKDYIQDTLISDSEIKP